MANRQATNPQPASGRITKAERKELARLERLQLQRKMARGRRNRWIALAMVLVLIAGVEVVRVVGGDPWLPFVGSSSASSALAAPEDLLRQSPDARQAAGCGEVKDVGPYQPEDQDRAHVAGPEEMPPLSRYASVPPASGPHNATPLGAGVYDSPPPIDRVIHSLEHGAAVVWYSPDASGKELDDLRAFYAQPEVGSRIIVAPYDYPDAGEAGRLPAGTSMALISWHHELTCAQVSLAAAFGFSAGYAAPPFAGETYLGDAPEAGVAF